MSLAIIYTRASLGVSAPLVTVEVHISQGLPGLTIVGLPETTVKEARDRVRSALINSGYDFPARKITINMAPADLPKEGGRYDLPIAIALLAASEQVQAEKLADYEFVGELALTGALRGISGAICAAMATLQASRQIIAPADNQSELGLINRPGCLIASHLQQVCAFLENRQPLDSPPVQQPVTNISQGDLCEIIGQPQGKRALEITASGGHNLLLMGPPGTGKTMLASRLTGLLPPLTDQEALESAAILSLVNLSRLQQNWYQRPFRSPHHSASLTSMVGGGSFPAPGEISLAHHGVLFLDELPEFERRVLDALREPIESGEIHISRTRAKISYPARFQLIAAMNPSPSGHLQGRHNRCSIEQNLRYLNRLSGPFLDRFDLSVDIPLPPAGTLSQQHGDGETSQQVRIRVQAARERQLQRQQTLNATLNNQQIRQFCPLQSADSQWLEHAFSKLGLSIRAWQRLVKVARTIADMHGEKHICRQHLQEALSYRAIDRMLAHLQKMIN